MGTVLLYRKEVPSTGDEWVHLCLVGIVHTPYVGKSG